VAAEGDAGGQRVKLPYDQTGDLMQEAGQPELGPHPVQSVQLFTHILDHQQGAAQIRAGIGCRPGKG
jgi:hypothetical protein